jgi:cell division protein ZapD
VIATLIANDTPTTSSASEADPIVYEQPLNERIRNLLRLEHLFEIVAEKSASPSATDARVALANLIEVVEMLIRSDIRTDLVKELERHAATLAKLEYNPNVDSNRLTELLLRVNKLINELREQRNLGQALRQDELVSAVRQRTTIPGGACNFDLPGYHFWLKRPYSERERRVTRWRDDLRLLEEGVTTALKAIRESAYPVRAQAKAGFYQQSLEPGSGCQLVRVVLPAELQLYPEISGGRQRFSLRFLELLEPGGRPTPTSRTVEFELHCCVL